jgi:hypothetical protein
MARLERMESQVRTQIERRKTGGLSNVRDEVEAGPVRRNDHGQGMEGRPMRHRPTLLRPEGFLPHMSSRPFQSEPQTPCEELTDANLGTLG